MEHSFQRSQTPGVWPALNRLSPHLQTHVKLLGRGRGVGCPGDVTLREVVGAVASVPGVLAAGPGPLVGEGGDEVVERPGHDGGVVGGCVEGNDADGIPDPWDRG